MVRALRSGMSNDDTTRPVPTVATRVATAELTSEDYAAIGRAVLTCDVQWRVRCHKAWAEWSAHVTYETVLAAVAARQHEREV